MTLNIAYACSAKTSYLALALNILLTIYLGIQMPKNDGTSNWLLCTCFDRQRSAREPPFFFQEVRIGMLLVSILFNLGRLMYEAIVKDISVILVTARLFLTMLQLVDHWWFCKNWESFFIEKKMRAYIWFRLFVAVCMFSTIYCVQTTFSPYRGSVWIEDGCQWIAGIQAIVWYLWGKRWDFKWGDMSDERRIPAIVGTVFTTSLIYGLLSAYLLGSHAPRKPVTSITASIAYLLMGFAFRYLNILTYRSSQECRRILDESKVASAIDGHSRGILGDRSSTAFADRSVLPEKGNSDGLQQPSSSHTPVSSTRRHSNLMNDIRRSLDSRNESSRRNATTTNDAERKFGNNIEMISHDNRVKTLDEDDEEKGNIDRQSVHGYTHPSSPFISPSLSLNGNMPHIDGNNEIALNSRPHESGDNIGSASASTNIAAGSVRLKPIHRSALFIPPSISLDGSLSHVDNSGSVSNNRIASNSRPHESGSDNIESASASVNKAAGRVRVKPIHSTSPFITPTISRSGSFSHIDGSNNSITLNSLNDSGDYIGSASASSNVGGDGVDSEPMRVKPNNSHTNSNSNAIVPLAPPLGDIIDDHFVIDHIPLARQNSLEANFTNYETAQLLGDKVVVVFVQVKLA